MYSLGSWVALLGALSLSSAAPTEQNITSDTYFYGDSPPVYPSPEGTGTGSWAAAYEKAKSFVAQLTDEEKVNFTAGYSTSNGCSGNIPAVSRLGFPGLCVSDAGNGLRGTDFVNGWSSGIHVGASWNKTLAHQRALYMGQEFHRKGVNVLLGPVVGPIGRIAEGGRNWEGFSTDPYHSGVLVYETVQGVQEAGVGVSVKHYIANEQETNRNPSTENGVTVASVSSNIDDKTIHELYLWPFQDAVLAGSVSVMCSYNRVNNSYGCQNSKTLNGLLKTELGFQGYVVTDWGAQHAGIAGANAGLDMVMPRSTTWNSNLTTAVANGSMEASRLDDMVTRIVASWYQLNQDTDFPSPGIGMPADVYAEHEVIIGTSADEKDTLLQSAIEGHVLVKNKNSALPLQSPRLVSVYGYDAKGPDSTGPTSTFSAVIPATQNYTLWVGGGSGSNNPAYITAPLDAIQAQARADSTAVQWDTTSSDPDVDPASEACLVFINSYASEGDDRTGLVDADSDTLVTNVASKCNNTIVVIHNAGIRLVYNWIDHANVTAVILAHLPGQDTGTAIADLLYGRANPSGRLPYTVAKQAADYGALLHPAQPVAPYGLFPQDDFTDGVYIDYRAFDRDNIVPQFEFGFGLSYTTFDYAELNIQRSAVEATQFPPAATIQEGGNPRLWDVLANVTAQVRNAGAMDGAEVAQLYVGIPGGPVRQLRGFDKVHVPVGETVSVTFPLTRRDLSTWNVEAQDWELQQGEYKVYVGRSSRDLPLTGELSI
ncbi:beta-glucosidase [Aspergillus homomorphus CBS 101889]|uniref:Probable beta-glucosidase M n=1 Tax=Aspergillus homomorphus (strain CBS 101889) TaxID=1450537 RepID=A0A395I6C9_ASPHC|nr:beta-glucosidase-related glycosidase [Aspergillus homomorphus CBS 101889]RAL15781.1 beta-glucosidase-related glycosidase [Aspergillus homomorphus CBS 101889]